MGLEVAAIARHLPARHRARDLHFRARRERQVGAVASAASPLAIAALAVILEDRCLRRLEANRAAGAAASESVS